MGWGLSGLSTIHRCPKTVAQDGVKGGVNLDANDRFCLDGQRLVVTSGTYGAVGSEYRTEIESFSKISSAGGSLATGPASFIVKTKDGKTLEYGVTSDSRIEAQGKTTVLNWALSRISDRYGNEVTFTYTEDNVAGHFRIDRIDYAANALMGLTVPKASVRFVYETRTDNAPGYVAGSKISSPVRMKNIKTYASLNNQEVMVRDYRLAYEYGTATGRSRLLSSTEYSASGASKPTVTFSWTQDDDTFTSRFKLNENGWNFGYNGTYQVLTGDFDGDGNTDYGRLGATVAVYYMNNGDGTFRSIFKPYGNGWNFGTGETYSLLVGDFNGDGKTDYGRLGATASVYFISNGDGTFTSRFKLNENGWNFGYNGTYQVLTGDFDGDGNIDYGRLGATVAVYYMNNGDGTFRSIFKPYGNGWNFGTGETYSLLVGDFNGDGKTDYGRLGATFAIYFMGNGDGTFTSSSLIPYGNGWNFGAGGTYSLLIGDFNGDGKTDYGRLGATASVYFISNGDGTFTSRFKLNENGWNFGYNGTYQVLIGDFNGDGKTDYGRLGATVSVYFISNGDGTFTSSLIPYGNGWNFGTGGTYSLLVGDFNGDGKTDYGRLGATAAVFFTKNSPNTSVDKLKSIRALSGATTTLTYKPLTDNSVYTKGTTAVDPVRDIQAPMYVVSEASTDNGAGGQRVTTYKYGGMKVDVSGRGNLGFEWMESTDNEPRGSLGLTLSTYTKFNQTYPFVGSANYSEQTLADGTVISRSETTMAKKLLNGGKTIFPYASQTVSKSYEINDGTNNPIATVTIDTAYDIYGNAEKITEKKTDAFGAIKSTRIVDNYYYPIDEANWLLSRLDRAVVSFPAHPLLKRTSKFAYNIKGLVSQEVIEPDNAALKLVTDYLYDGFGNRISSTISAAGAVSRTTSSTYDAIGQFPLSTTNAEGHSESYLWDARFGVKSSLTGPNGLTTTWAYDAFGRKTTETRADGTTTTITYHMDVAPFYITKQSSGMPAKTVYFDKLGRKTRTEGRGFNNEIIYVDSEYNALGQVSRKSGPYASTGTAKWTTYNAYDAVGRLTSFTKPDGTTTTTIYDGLTTSVTNAKLQKRTEIKDLHGRVYQVIDSMSGTLTYAYDPFGNLISTTDSAGHQVIMSYDLRGRKTGMNDPDMGIWSYAYNAFGELTSQSNANTQTTTMTYDKLGRMLSRTELEGASSWVYDLGFKAAGKLVSETAPNGYSKYYSYDGFGRPISTNTLINNNSYLMSTSYNTIGQVDTITYPTSFAVKRVYNAQGYLSEVQNAANAAEVFWKADTVDEEGHVLQETLGSGLTTNRQYNQTTGRLEAIMAGPNGSVQNLGFAYDSLGNLNSRSDYVMNWTESFTYDALNRITGATGPAIKTYAYDAIGNITSKSDVGAYTYDPLHPHAVKTAGGNTYTYDLNGNMTSGAGRNLTWTSFDRPATISNAGAYTSMIYDANHKRIMKSTALGETTVYIGGGFEEVSLAGITKAKHYIRSGNGLVAIMEQINQVKLMKYVHNDQLGSINVITDGTGAVLERLSFDAFGKPRNANATDATTPITSTQTTRGYTGHKMDAEVGLINMNARLYDPVLGRFISADVTIDTPTDMQTYNRYHYVMNNPFRYTDPSGNSWKSKLRRTVIGAVIVVVGAAVVVVSAIAENPTGISAGLSIMAAGINYMGTGQINVPPTPVVSATTDATGGGSWNTTIGTPLGTIDYAPGNGGTSYTGVSGGSGSGSNYSGNISINGMQGGVNNSNAMSTTAYQRLFNNVNASLESVARSSVWDSPAMGSASSILVGFGDGISGGASNSLRGYLGTNRYVDKNLATYKNALTVGTVGQIGVTGTVGTAITFASFGTNFYEGNKNNMVVDAITFGTSRTMTGGSKGLGMQIFGNAWGYVFGQTALSTAP